MSNIYTRLLLNTDGFDKNLFKAQKNLQNFATTSKGVFAGLSKFAGYAAAFTGLSTSIHAAVTANMEFEKSLSSLRSLTGVSASELNYFRTEAIRMGMDSTQSAKEMVDAFKLIGSQMPELLKNKEALTQTAEAAVTLAEAAELDVPTAAKALTGSLNQMGASSAYAAEYINILAAASQKGSADIPYLNKAIENAGGAASSVGVKFNELVAAIEAIAPKITDAASNGTNLRNIFLTLESATDNNLRPSVVGLSKALENLAAKNMDAVQLTKMFGKESVTAAIALINERDAFEDLRTGIQGTNTAYEQARINNDNLAGSIGKLQSSWTSFINTMSSSNGILKNAVDNLRDAVNWATRAIAMTGDQKKVYDNKANTDEAIKRMDLYIQKGEDAEMALKKTMADLTKTMFPDVQFLEEYRKKAQLLGQQSKTYGGSQYYDELKKYNELYRTALKQKDTYDVITKQLNDHLSSINAQEAAAEEAAKKAEEEAKAAKEKAAAEAAAEAAKKKAEEEAKRPKGSFADLDFQLKEQQKKLAQATTNEARSAVQKTINELEAKKIFLKAQVETTLFQAGRTAPQGYATENKISLGDLAKVDFSKVKLPDIKPAIQDNEDYASSFIQISNAIGTMTNAMSANSDSIGQWAMNSIGSIAQMIMQLQSLATAQGVASAAALPFPASLGAIATVVATIASIFSSLPKYADGGIVGGSSFYGDKLLARVNSGEMILNKKQQEALYGMTGGTEITLGVSRIQGADLYLSLKNYMSKTGKRL